MNKKYIQVIQGTKTLSDLNQIKEDFLAECKKHECKIMVSNLLGSIDNFCSAKHIFETMAIPLMSKRGGKKLINNYTKIIKENESLRTLYAYHEGLTDNDNSNAKKAYITEALVIGNPVKHSEYIKGIGDLIGIISEAFKLLGDEYVLNNISNKPELKEICESLLFLATHKKNIVNLNEYINHIDRVSSMVNESKNDSIDANLPLGDIVDKLKNNKANNIVEIVFNTNDREKAFNQTKDICMEMICKQKNSTDDTSIYDKLNEMESKLSKKEYNFDTFTKDMLYMIELQEVLK